jgi:precorrin-2 dehydrogenase/sirohydrochlorin ferrochelatase
MPKYYPIMLDVRHRPAFVIGGNRIAAEKAANLSASGAVVTAINPDFCEELLSLEQRREVTLRYKTYEPGDLAGAFVVVAATNDPQCIEAVWSETQERGQLVNIVDVPARCSFILPSILRRDQLTIAVSTEGASPSLAKRIRQRLEGLFPPAYGAYLRLAAIAREHMRRQGLSYAQRDDFFGDFFNSETLSFLAEKNETAALAATVDLLRSYQIEIAPEKLARELKESGEGR